MQRILKIHKSFEEQEAFDLERMRMTTPLQRLRNLFYMQNFTRALRKGKKEPSIKITHGYPTS